MAGEANSPKYFIVEYLDGGVWKSVEADLLTAPENPAVRYTYKCSGTATGSSYQHATVMQTMRFENAVTDGEVKIRCRAVGSYTISLPRKDDKYLLSCAPLNLTNFPFSYILIPFGAMVSKYMKMENW